ncbi:MAG: tRNA1(Val) (adenine(37)-N6)-methyltransferase [Eubacteriales bacterium]|nr:tRNA1(Val) (adenine(37)-N6)-methyltransferase [Eubacteriales bacterium]
MNGVKKTEQPAGIPEEIRLYEGERIDDLQRNGCRIIQNKNGFCFGMDAVLLSGFGSLGLKENAVDLGTGTGIIPILLHAKYGGGHIYGIEVQERVAEMAAASVLLNGYEQSVSILCGNLREVLSQRGEIAIPEAFAAADRFEADGSLHLTPGTGENPTGAGDGGTGNRSAVLRAGSFDVVTSNPPYMKGAHGLKNPDEGKAIARHELLCTLEDVCGAAAKLLRSGGRFYMVHRPQRLIEIIAALRAVHLEPKRLKFVHPFTDREANMVLIEAVKDAGSECRVEKPLIVYREQGRFTDEIYDIYGY